ncbi:hypothetical protein H312_01816 [Anncaliia algerae PRA339]|uniref:Vps41 beta-propeller domain-containing protein n=1 Tax=Anncaliia algerae PRA339 TaxID=1288291 RepID=A0A059F0C8_9MICR|nr:hypothetical protein H312_01816 [Anncaliia algerae PRA339]
MHPHFMYRQNFLQQLDNLKKEFDTLTSENNNLRTMLKKHEERAAFFHQEIKIIKNTIVELQSQIKVKKVIQDDLPRTYHKGTKKIKLGAGWSVENQRIANIRLMHTITLPTTIGLVEVSDCGNYLGIVCAASIFLFFLKDFSVLYLNHKNNRMEEVTNSYKPQVIKEYDFKIIFSKDSKYIYTDNGDNCIRKWCIESKVASRLLLNFDALAWGWYKDNLVIADNKNIIIYDLNNQLQLPFFKDKTEIVETITSLLVVNDETILIGTRSGKILLIKNDLIEEFSVHTKQITSLAINSNNQLISGSLDKTVVINHLDLKNNEITLINDPMRHDDYILNVRFFDDNTHFVSCSRDSTFRIWDFDNKEMRIIAHNGPVTGIATKGRLLISAGLDKRIRVWDVDFTL